MHMAIGKPDCCGVVEIFPQGEFSPIRGYGNMARRIGHHYVRMDIDSRQSKPDGVTVSPELLLKHITSLIEQIKEKPTCVLRSVIEDPYFDVSVPASASSSS
jgi:hypothetical protein